ncbi:hypothetical protein K466DRAFT_410607 [Polyporus arcularius HHB13444]|uniref:Uncharacterized protein n=1 Tax=Polyporus arcularius HHB13444 TaxID=1314778 RepID=A0A5C3NUY6_9APHY|nr:hypothetical protein K466DRAFT_410607 [Polyporus arcularius HHB13444]
MSLDSSRRRLNDDAIARADAEGDGAPDQGPEYPPPSRVRRPTCCPLSLLSSPSTSLLRFSLVMLPCVAFPSTLRLPDLITTLRLAIIASILAITLLVATSLSLSENVVYEAGFSGSRHTRAAQVSQGLSRPVSPASTPSYGRKLDGIYGSHEAATLRCYHLEGHAALAGVAGRVTSIAAERVWRSIAQPDTEAEARPEYFSAKDPSGAHRHGCSLGSKALMPMQVKRR